MPLEQTGVKLIIDGYSQFISGMAKSTEAIANFGRMTQNRLAAVQAMGKAASDVAVQGAKIASSYAKIVVSESRLATAEERTKQVLTALAVAQERTRQSANSLASTQEKTVQSANKLASSQERTKQVISSLAIAQERTTQSANKLASTQERTKQASSRLASAQERTKQTLNNLSIAQERTTQSANKLASSQERTKQESSRLATAQERIRQVTLALAIAQERTTQSANHMAREQARAAAALSQITVEKIRAKIAATNLKAAHEGLSQSVDRSRQSFGQFVAGISIGVSIANIAVSAIQNMSRYLLDMGKSAVTAAGDLQYLTIRIENLLARQYRLADSTMEVSKSLEIASTRTAALTEWIKNLALTTPFGVDDISKTFSMALAMGWTEDAAKELTTAILDYSAAMGLQSDQMDRIIFNFAQMKAAGKVTATEMRDLARGAFFPLTQVLDEAAKQLGITAEGLIEFRKAAAEGQIGIEEFFNAFITVVSRDFPDAAKRMNYTLVALKDNIKDFFEVNIGWDLLGKVVAKFALTASLALERLRKAFDGTIEATNSFDAFADTINMTSEQLRDYGVGWSKLGDGLLYVFDSVVQAGSIFFDTIKDILAALGIGAPTVRDFAEALAAIGYVVTNVAKALHDFVNKYVVPFINQIKNFFGGLANDAFNWGSDLITEFANGIVQTAATVITAAMNWISDALSNWLVGHSPPKIAPDIDQWGMEAMAEFLHGFTLVDFDVLDSVQGALEDSLQALVDLGDLDESEFGDLFVGISEDLIEAISNFEQTGEIGSEIFEQLRDIGGGFGEELAILLERQVALADAIQEAADAQEELNAAQDATKEATKNVNKLVKEYNALLRAGADKKTLKDKLAQVNAAEDDLKLAREREIAAQEAKDQADEALKPLKEAVELQERLIAQLVELAKAQAAAAEAGGGGGDGGGGDEEDEWPEVPGGESLKSKLDTWWEEIKKAMIDKLSGAWQELIDKWKGSIDENIGKILGALGILWDTVLLYWNQILANLTTAWENFLLFLETYGPGILENLASALGTIVGAIVYLALEIGLFLSEVALDWSQWLLDNGPLVEKLAGFVKYLAEKAAELAKAIWEDLKPGLWQWSETFQTGLTTFVEIVTSETFQKLLDNIFRLAGYMSDLFGWLLKLAGVLAEHAIIAFGQWWKDNGTSVNDVFGKFVDIVGRLVDYITSEENTEGIITGFDRILQFLGDLAALPLNILSGDLNAVAEGLKSIIGYLLFEGETPQWFLTAADFIAGCLNFVIDTAQKAIDTINLLLNPGTSHEGMEGIHTNVEGAWNQLGQLLGLNLTGGVVEGVKEGTDEVGSQAEETGKYASEGISTGIDNNSPTLFQKLGQWITDIIDAFKTGFGVKSPSTVMASIGWDIGQGLIDGINSRAGDLIAAATALAASLIAAVLEWLGISSPSTVFEEMGEQSVLGFIEGIYNEQDALVEALQDVFGDFDLEELFDIGGSFGGFGSYVAKLFKKQTIDPMEQQAKDLDKRIEELQDLIASGDLDYYAQISAEAELTRLTAERADLAEDIAAQQQKILDLQEQQQKLEFLKQQMELLKTIEEYGLDPETILGGLELGLNASLDDLLAAMTAAMKAIVAQAEEELEAGSPSKVFMRLGKGVSEGFSEGVLGTVYKGTNAIERLLGGEERYATRGSLAPTMQAQPIMSSQNVSFGNVYINDKMDWATFKNQVQRAVMEQ